MNLLVKALQDAALELQNEHGWLLEESRVSRVSENNVLIQTVLQHILPLFEDGVVRLMLEAEAEKYAGMAEGIRKVLHCGKLGEGA